MIALHLILWLYGWNSEQIYVMIFDMLFILRTLCKILQMTKYLIMVFISLIKCYMLVIRDLEIGHPCLYHKWIGKQQWSTDLLQNSNLMTLRSRRSWLLSAFQHSIRI